MSTVNQLFTEKFRPQELSSLILPPRIRNQLSKGLIQNLLLFGSAGNGKTSALFILAKNYPTLFLNASQEGGIDILRNRITRFCSTISLEGGKEKLKCVILDEIEGASEEFFKALRAIMEKFASTTRFIASTNYIQKIPEPVGKSRFHYISFDPINNEEETYLIEEYKKRITLILNAAKIKFNDEILDKFVRNDFPDMRSLLNKIQSFHLSGIKELNSKNFNINRDYEDLFKMVLSKPDRPDENYKIIIGEYGSRVDETLYALGNDLINYIMSNVPEKIDKIPLIAIAVAEYQAQRTMVIDPLITLCACCFKLQTILN